MMHSVSWITFTADDVKARMAAREREVYEEVAGAGEEEPIDRMEAIVAQVLASFRGAIRANPNVTEMGAAGTLPDFCIYYASIIARNSLIALPPTQEGMTDPRSKEQSEAERFLRDLRTMPSSAFGDDPSSGSESSSSYGGAALLDF